MAKRREATPEYLQELRRAKERAETDLTMAKIHLYKYTAAGKLFQEEFEVARMECVQATERLYAIQKEIGRVEMALLKLPELPLEED